MSTPPADGRAGRAPAWSPEDDVPLVRLAQSGDAASFDALYVRHARVVHAVLLGRSGSREDAEDLVQEVFLAAWRQLATLRDPAAFAGWVMTIARHQRIDHARRARELTPLADVEARLAGTRPVDTARLEAERALAAVRALPPAYVRVNLCRGMKLLREALADDRVRSAGSPDGGRATQDAGPAHGWPVRGAER